MSQMTFSEDYYQNKKRKTRCEIFLERIDKLILWSQTEKKVALYYPKGHNGQPPYPMPSMLRVHCMQLFYNLSDPAMEDADHHRKSELTTSTAPTILFKILPEPVTSRGPIA
jgi:hypothetical protein